MTSFVPVSLLNASYIDVQLFLKSFFNESCNILLTVTNLFSLSDADATKHSVESLQQVYDIFVHFLWSFVDFDEFQHKILRLLFLVLISTLLLISILWHFFGQRICDRFMRPATSRAIEELKASVARLKLPKVHSPRN